MLNVKNHAITGVVLGGITLLILAQSPSFASGAICGTQFANSAAASATSASETAWRQAFTSGEMAKTSAARENEIMSRQKLMEDEVLGEGKFAGHGDTPPMEFFAEEGVKTKVVYKTDGTDMMGAPTRIIVSGLGSQGILRGTGLFPASGHTGPANARKYAAMDTFNVTVDQSLDKDGKQWNQSFGTSGEKSLVSKAKSLGLVTAVELEMQLSTAHASRMIYYRSGSLGPDGYSSGRTYEIIWDGT